ncbi:unnamed protein product [Gulo gulo]|uniref:Uncharacterized protein n=1 Tax=Gulo gulo TaxID=48420 RepID=A0A9X9M3L4_GULGU|nr:unnamed protein product [Gulo gulo]
MCSIIKTHQLLEAMARRGQTRTWRRENGHQEGDLPEGRPSLRQFSEV